MLQLSDPNIAITEAGDLVVEVHGARFTLKRIKPRLKVWLTDDNALLVDFHGTRFYIRDVKAGMVEHLQRAEQQSREPVLLTGLAGATPAEGIAE